LPHRVAEVIDLDYPTDGRPWATMAVTVPSRRSECSLFQLRRRASRSRICARTTSRALAELDAAIGVLSDDHRRRLQRNTDAASIATSRLSHSVAVASTTTTWRSPERVRFTWNITTNGRSEMDALSPANHRRRIDYVFIGRYAHRKLTVTSSRALAFDTH